MDELLSWLRSFLGLPIASTAEEVLAELNELSNQLQTAINNGTVTAKTVLQYLTENQPVLVTAKQTLGFQQQVLAKLGLDEKATPEQALALIVTAKASEQQLTLLNTEVQQLKQEKFVERFNVVIAKSMQSGRILPMQKSDEKWLDTQRDWAKKDFASFEQYFCTTAPVIGPLGGLPNSEGGEAAVKGITEEDIVVASAFGLTKDQVAKNN